MMKQRHKNKRLTAKPHRILKTEDDVWRWWHFERGIQETLGKYTRFILPGLGFQIPFVHILRVRDVREHTMDIHPQPVITKDNVEIQVDGIMWVRPTADEESIKRTFYNIDDWKRAIAQLAMTNVRQEFGDLTLDESLVARETIATNLQRILNTFAVEWGLTVSKVEIRLIDPPEDIKRAMHKQKTAEQERRSMRLLATGEYEAAEQEKLAIIRGRKGSGKRSFKRPRTRRKPFAWSTKPPRNISSEMLNTSSRSK